MYKIQVTRQAMKDLSNLPEDYAQAISQHIDALAEQPRPAGVKKLPGALGVSLLSYLTCAWVCGLIC